MTNWLLNKGEKMLLGALVGDYIGSYYEKKENRTKNYNFELFHKEDRFTDDSILTIAVLDGLLDYKQYNNDITLLSTIIRDKMVKWGNSPEYYGKWFGKNFLRWLETPIPYQSVGNGAAMRISGVAHIANSEEEVKLLSKIVTDVSHNCEQSERAAECVAISIYKILHGAKKEEIIETVSFYYPLIMGLNLDELRPYYKCNITCDGSVPVAIKAFIDSKDFENALRLSISMGGDADTLGAITCSIAGAYYGIPLPISDVIMTKIDDKFRKVLDKFEQYRKK